MKKVVFIVMAASVISVAHANMITNGDFENLTAPQPFSWFTSANATLCTTDNGPSAAGSNCGQIVTTAAGQNYQLRTMAAAVLPGNTYTVAWDYKSIGATTGYWYLFMRYWMGVDQYGNGTGFTGTQNWIWKAPTNGQWSSSTFQSVAPSNANYIDLVFYNNNYDGTFVGTLRVDNVVLTPEPITLTLLALGLPLLRMRRA